MQAGAQQTKEENREGEHEKTAYLAAALNLPRCCWWSGCLRHELRVGVYRMIQPSREEACS